MFIVASNSRGVSGFQVEVEGGGCDRVLLLQLPELLETKGDEIDFHDDSSSVDLLLLFQRLLLALIYTRATSERDSEKGAPPPSRLVPPWTSLQLVHRGKPAWLFSML